MPSPLSRASDGSALRIGIAIVRSGEAVLVGMRDRESVLGGMHEFPGGKCLPDESPAECAVRECREEAGLDVAVVELLDRRRHHYDHGEVDLSFFLCRPMPDQQELSPLPPFAWIPVGELARCTFPPANQAVVERLCEASADP
jgi:8-oxo-dGTP diphosphatase